MKIIGTYLGLWPYLLLPHHVKYYWLLSEEDRELLRKKINPSFNKKLYGGAGATGYDEIHQLSNHGELQALRRVLEKYGPFQHVLDVGIGSGFYASEIAPHTSRYSGTDISPDFEPVLRQVFSHKFPKLPFHFYLMDHVRDELRLPQKVDGIFILHTLHHLVDRAEIMRRMADNLTDNGVIVLLEPHLSPQKIVRTVRSLLREYRSPSYFRQTSNWATHDKITHGEIRYYARRSGLKIAETIYIDPGTLFEKILPSDKLSTSRFSLRALVANQIVFVLKKNL